MYNVYWKDNNLRKSRRKTECGRNFRRVKKYSPLFLSRTCVIRTFADSNKISSTLENLITKNPIIRIPIIRISVIRTFHNSNILTPREFELDRVDCRTVLLRKRSILPHFKGKLVFISNYDRQEVYHIGSRHGCPC